MRRWIRLAWVGVTNSLLLAPLAYAVYSVTVYGSRWGIELLSVYHAWAYIVGAILGFALDASQQKNARLVNVGIWLLLALRTTSMYIGLWRPSSDVRLAAAYVASLAWTVATINFFLYRPTRESSLPET